MSGNEEDLKKLIEAAEKSIQEGKEFRTAPLMDKSAVSHEIEKEIKEQKEEETKSDWDEWEKQIKESGRDKKETGSLAGIFTLVAIILAIGVMLIFHLNFTAQQEKMSRKPRINVDKLTDKNETQIAKTTEGEKSKVATHNGIPSAQAPSDYKPVDREELRKSRRDKRKSMKTPIAPGTTTPVPELPPGSGTGEKPGDNLSRPEPGGENRENLPSWAKEEPPPRTTPQGDPIFIQ